MRVPPPLLLALAAVCAALPAARAADATKIDATTRVEPLNPSAETTKSVEQVEIKRDDHVQDSRAMLPGVIEEPTAPLANRTAPIDVKETHEKTIIDHKDAPLPSDPIAHKDSRLDGQAARDQFQPTNLYRKATTVADKYQQGIRDANEASIKVQPDLNKQTTFDKLNRFIFRRNGPGTEDGNALVSAAGGGTASAPATAATAGTAASSGSALPDSSGGSFEVLGVIAAPGQPPPPPR